MSQSSSNDISLCPLSLQPEGIQKVQSRTVVLDPSGELHLRTGGPPVEGVQDGKQFSTIPLTLPEETVPGSAHCSISVTGRYKSLYVYYENACPILWVSVRKDTQDFM